MKENMSNQAITGRHLKYALALFLVGSSLVGSGVTEEAGNDSWIAMIIGIAGVMPLLFLYNGILRLYPGENLYQIAMHVFGRVGGTVVGAVYIFYAIHLGALVLNIFAEFVHVMNMPDTPKLAIEWFLILPCIFGVYRGTAVMGRVARFLFPLVVFAVLATDLLALRDANFSNLQPILGTGMGKMSLAVLNIITLPAGEAVVFTTFFNVNPKENYRKILISGVLMGMVILLVANLRNLLLLGVGGVKLFPYTSYSAVSILGIGDFFTRMEVIIGINLMIGGFYKVIGCSFSAAIGMASIFRRGEYKYFAVPVCLLILIFAQTMFQNSTEALEFVKSYKYYVLGYQLFLPAAILITGTIKKHRQQAAQATSGAGEEPAAP